MHIVGPPIPYFFNLMFSLRFRPLGKKIQKNSVRGWLGEVVYPHFLSIVHVCFLCVLLLGPGKCFWAFSVKSGWGGTPPAPLQFIFFAFLDPSNIFVKSSVRKKTSLYYHPPPPYYSSFVIRFPRI